ncbi:GroES-like protein [Stereum hirsutum FP-91666 SS1]|uniref:GroES-like protein n=1 Tax=Stereum hirsutum (strain FP-91666) TaxID=721885 RepID=UPI00044496A9|nr:GroES-like protein [Stereum hirsutum FP-91666 SS1]EIM82228.1 GroES-like protein [Stereum hirsutum FP-91666 SS1]
MSIPSSQLGVFIKGSTPSFVVERHPVLQPGPGEALIKVRAVAVNPTDWKIIVFGGAQPGNGSGNDYAGEIVALGPGTHTVEVGQRVAGWMHAAFDKTHFAFQEYLITRSDLLIKVPANIPNEEAAAIPVGATTAIIGLSRLFDFPQRAPLGKTILVCGGASSVGMYVCQLAKISGLRVIATASRGNFEVVSSLGASAVVDRHASDVQEQIIREAGPAGVDYVFDAVSFGSTITIASSVLNAKLGGFKKAAVVLPIPPSSLDPHVEYHSVGIQTIWNKPYEFLGASIPALPRDMETAKAGYQAVSDWLEKGKFKANPVVLGDGGLHGVPDGIAAVQAGKITGSKLVYRISG